MKLLLTAGICIALLAILISRATYALPPTLAPTPSINWENVVTLPYVYAEDGTHWKAALRCDFFLEICRITHLKEICKPNTTDFSPSFCGNLPK